MANAKRDQNGVEVMLATSSVDGVTPIALVANPTTHILEVEDNTTGSDLSGAIAERDENRVAVIMAVSSADGVTPVPVYINPATNKLLTDST